MWWFIEKGIWKEKMKKRYFIISLLYFWIFLMFFFLSSESEIFFFSTSFLVSVLLSTNRSFFLCVTILFGNIIALLFLINTYQLEEHKIAVKLLIGD